MLFASWLPKFISCKAYFGIPSLAQIKRFGYSFLNIFKQGESMTSNKEFEPSDRELEEIMGPIRAMGRLKTIQTRTLSPDFKKCPKKELERLLNRAKDAVLEDVGPQSESQFKDVERRIEDRLNSIKERRRFIIILLLNIIILIATFWGLFVVFFNFNIPNPFTDFLELVEKIFRKFDMIL